MVDIQRYNAIDEALLDSAKVVKPLKYVEPVNKKEEEEAFLSGSKREPDFVCGEPEYDPEQVEQNLGSIEIPEDTLGKIFQKKRDILWLDNKIVKYRGNADLVQEATQAMYGAPTTELVGYAHEILNQIPNEQAELTVPADSVKRSLEKALENHGLTEWRVEFSDKKLTQAYPAERKMTVCKDRMFADNDPARLAVHEVGVHALRAANGYEQPLNIFAIGLPGYMSTEEGLAAYAEEVTGTTDEQTLRNYAGRVIAVDSVCQALTFRQTFDRLKALDFSDKQAWDLSLRAHRGGGFIKDHVYLEGLVKVRDFAQNNGDFNTLYVGKVGLDDLPLVYQLLQEGTLKPAQYIPQFL